MTLNPESYHMSYELSFPAAMPEAEQQKFKILNSEYEVHLSIVKLHLETANSAMDRANGVSRQLAKLEQKYGTIRKYT